MEIEAAFSHNFRKARKQGGYKQRNIIDKTGFTQTFVSRVETRKCGITLGNAAVLAEAVGQPLCKLLHPVEK